MLQTEFVRSMNANYERVLLEQPPQENRYQYCILSRGGIKGLLSSSLRYLNGSAYLYYDITSKQNITQLYGRRCITRGWLKDFIWSLGQIQKELGRFLLDEQNVIWHPEQIYQDLESNIFSFLYIPYYDGENGFRNLLEYFVEHIDYDDEVLVECVYKMYEQFERNGAVYLQGQIFEDVKMLEENKIEIRTEISAVKASETKENDIRQNGAKREDIKRDDIRTEAMASERLVVEQSMEEKAAAEGMRRRGIRSLWNDKKRKYREKTENYQQRMELLMDGYAVAEETVYDEDYGKTIYMEETKDLKEIVHRLYTLDGRIVIQLEKEVYTIGKKKNEADLVLEDFAVSRIHARISREQDNIYLEDLNSTNGTYKNGLRMQPYEKSKLEVGDEIRIGKTELIYR